mmetsp:Transcript_40965/g.92106  ORF Transcript_40965/g.92106 Transcript_40965/m.92106 type:complete len:385 (-) Transcript_40965:515-1669(-)
MALHLLGNSRRQAVVACSLEYFDGCGGVVLRHGRGLEELLKGREVLDLCIALQQQGCVLSLGEVALMEPFEVLGHVTDSLRIQVALDNIRRLQRQPKIHRLCVDRQRLVISTFFEKRVPVLAVDIRRELRRGAAMEANLLSPLEHALLYEDVQPLREPFLPELEKHRIAVRTTTRDNKDASKARDDMRHIGELTGVSDKAHVRVCHQHAHCLPRHRRWRRCPTRTSPEAQGGGAASAWRIGRHRNEIRAKLRERQLVALQRHGSHVALIGIVGVDSGTLRNEKRVQGREHAGAALGRTRCLFSIDVELAHIVSLPLPHQPGAHRCEGADEKNNPRALLKEVHGCHRWVAILPQGTWPGLVLPQVTAPEEMHDAASKAHSQLGEA